MNSKTIYIVRHGQTDHNVKNELQGRRDIPMNGNGRQQASMLRDWFRTNGVRFDAVFSSPLGRAVETAEIITGGSPEIRTDNRLLEMDYGPYEGLDLAHPPAEIVTFFSDFAHNPAPDGMESLASVVKRAGDFLESIRDVPGTTILISTHAIAMKGLLEYLTPASGGAYWSKYIGNCGLYRTVYTDGIFSVPEEVCAFVYPLLL